MKAELVKAIEAHRTRVERATALYKSALHTRNRADRMFDLYRKNCIGPDSGRYLSLMLRSSSLFLRRLNSHTNLIISLSHRVAELEAR